MRRAETLSLETPPVTTEWDSSWRLHIYSPFLLQHYLMIHLESTQWLWVKNKIALGKKSGGSYLDLMNEWWFILTLSLSSLTESNTWDLRLNLVGMKITLLNMNRVKKERNYTNQNPPPPVLYHRDAQSSVVLPLQTSNPSYPSPISAWCWEFSTSLSKRKVKEHFKSLSVFRGSFWV